MLEATEANAAAAKTTPANKVSLKQAAQEVCKWAQRALLSITARRRKHYNVVVLDPWGDIGQVIDSVLARHGYRTHCVSNWRRLLKDCHDDPPEVVVVDVDYAPRFAPDIGGRQNDPFQGRCRLVVVGASGEKTITVRCDAAFRKPYPVAALVRKIEELIDKRRPKVAA